MKEELLKRAWAVMENAYVPYSNFRVGACVLCKNGQYYCGANIENASYGVTSCAERNALFAAYSAGQRKADIVALAIVSDELVPADAPIYLSSKTEQIESNIRALLPMSFSQEDLKHV